MPGKALVVLLLLHAAFVAFLAFVLIRGEAGQVHQWGRDLNADPAPASVPAP